MFRKFLPAAAAFLAAACSTVPAVPPAPPASAGPIEVQILALNDFHGNLEPSPTPVRFQLGSDQFASGQLGGAAVVGAELAKLRAGRQSITVAAGDLIGASPLTSAYFLDEPTVDAMNLMRLDLASVGNHEFDKGTAELFRMQNGGCGKNTTRVPCRLERFGGARFQYLAANVVRDDEKLIFPATAIRQVGPVKIGFIGMTLKSTGTLVTPAGVAGLHFKDEAETANALVPELKAAGAEAIVLLIHQGGKTSETYKVQDCDGLSGDILPILDKLDPAIATVISGHTHNAYACEMDRGGAHRLLTSAGKYGYFLTDLRLDFDPTTHRLVGQQARNIVVGNGEQGNDAAEQALVDRYAAAVAPIASRIIGRLTAPAPNAQDESESPAADLIADSMLAATRAPNMGGAQLALVNATGVRVSLPSGDIKYADAFQVMPFGNNLVVMTLSGAQLRSVIEQQYRGSPPPVGQRPHALATSAGFTYAVDMAKPAGSRVSDIRLNGRPIDSNAPYRVVVNNYLASGGDSLTGFTAGTDLTDNGIVDLDALVAWIAPGRTPPVPNRIRVSP